MTVTPTARQHPWACHVDMSPLVVGRPPRVCDDRREGAERTGGHMSEQQAVTARLHVTGIGPYLRREYRRLREGGFEPRDATLVIFGMVRAAEAVNVTISGDVDLRVAKR